MGVSLLCSFIRPLLEPKPRTHLQKQNMRCNSSSNNPDKKSRNGPKEKYNKIIFQGRIQGIKEQSIGN